jgi:tight adherence protein B
MVSFFVFLFFMLLVLGIYMMIAGSDSDKRERIQKRLADAVHYSAKSKDSDVQLARQELLSEIPELDRILAKFPVAIKLKLLIDQADAKITVMRLILFCLFVGLAASFIVSLVTTFMIFVAGAFGASVLPILYILYKRNQRLNKFLELLPDALELLARSLSAGHSFAESLYMVSTEMPEPIATEFRKTYEEQNLGLSLKLALESLAERVPLLDVRLCITAIMIQRETGGNLSEILERVAHTIRDRFRILEDLKTLTTSQRMSAWILCALPIFVAIAANVLNPEYMHVMWADPRGHKLLATAAVLQIMGMIVIRRILRIRI